jgi:5'-nucleotidase
MCAGCGSATAVDHEAVTAPEADAVSEAVVTAPESGCEISKKAKDTVAFRRLVAEPVTWRDPALQDQEPSLVRVKILGFNDFHGQLSNDKRVEGRPVGGAAVLAAYFKRAMAGVEGETIIVHAGDLVGASPPASALHQDEPAIAFLNALANDECDQPETAPNGCNVVTALGNHELDEGVDEIKRLLRGEDHSEGPFLGKSHARARFPMLSANVVDAKTGETFLPAFVVRELKGIRIGFVGAMLQDAAKYLLPSGISGIRFEEEVASVQNAVDELKERGVRAIVLVLHQGGHQRWGQGRPGDDPGLEGPIAEIVRALDGEVDLVIGGHTHDAVNILTPNGAGRPTLVNLAFYSGMAFSDIDLDIDKTSGEVVGKTARIVTTWADEGPGLKPDAEIAAMMEAAEAAVRERTSEVVTEVSSPFPKRANCDGESAIGSLIADAQRAALNADFAFIQPSWIRAGLAPGPLTWGEIFAVQPFGNRVVRLEMTGQQVMDLLNQQWIDPTHSRVFNVSGLTFTWDPSRAEEARIVEVLVGGQPLDMAAVYTVAVNEFLAQGGELYSVFTSAKRLEGEVLDIDALVKYLRSLPKPINPKIEGRICRVKTHV